MARSSARAWWTEKVGRVVRFVWPRIGAAERAEVAALLTPRQMALFETMPRPDQRHGLDVARTLGRAGFREDAELIVAGLLHDAGKGHAVRLWHRVAWSLGQRYGARIVAVLAVLPGARNAFDRLEHHAETSAQLAHAAGSSERTIALIAEQAEPSEPAARVLHLADEGELPASR